VSGPCALETAAGSFIGAVHVVLSDLVYLQEKYVPRTKCARRAAKGVELQGESEEEMRNEARGTRTREERDGCTGREREAERERLK